MIVDTGNVLYDMAFSCFQVEITGRCNMLCKHCRGKNDEKLDMSLSDFLKVIEFAKRNKDKKLHIILSGGEPFLHKDIKKILQLLLKNKFDDVSITTNGSVCILPYLDILSKFNKLSLSVSLDSFDYKEHDEFRGFSGAYDRAMSFIKTAIENNIKTNIRISILPSKIKYMEDMVHKAIGLNLNVISFASILPVGEALNHTELLMSQEQKRLFISEIFRLRTIYNEQITIECGDPLQAIFRTEQETIKNGLVIVNGCTAGIGMFNVFANGNVTPCVHIERAITNIKYKSVDDIEKDFVNNNFIKKLIQRQINGKCIGCGLLYECGGCRARAYYKYNDYFVEDPDCWL